LTEKGEKKKKKGPCLSSLSIKGEVEEDKRKRKGAENLPGDLTTKQRGEKGEKGGEGTSNFPQKKKRRGRFTMKKKGK